MTPPEQPPGPGEEFATAAALAGVAREVEGLRRTVERLRTLPSTVEKLAGLVAQTAETTAGTGTGGSVAGSWLVFPPDRQRTYRLLDDLIGWVRQVCLRYPDATVGLPECWLWHPDVIEELLALKAVWHTAYDTEESPAWVAADWHDRYRPGVVARIAQRAGRCSVENHPPREPDRSENTHRHALAGLDAIADWWALARDRPAPIPPSNRLSRNANYGYQGR